MKETEKPLRLSLMVGALGVVYGDIGTSPLYTLRECFAGPHSIAATPENVLGVISLVVWCLGMIVSGKYIGLVMRAHNRGEGGILALLSLAVPERKAERIKGGRFLLTLGVFGAALLYGDGMITAPVTVLGAVEGLEVATPLFKPYVAPLAVLILVAIFSVQRFGTGKVGNVYGPIMFVWFVVLGVLGVRGILMNPVILEALSPYHALAFLARNGHLAFLVLGSVFLAVTGAEALFADMGHFGAGPIRRAWFGITFPALILNYLGEGALLLARPEAAQNPFFMLAPSWGVVPLVGLATMAAVIASQASIAGAYSVSMQGIQMGYLPRLVIQHTSKSEHGQIYMPQVNAFLMIVCVGLALGFRSSSRLAGAYGISVSMTMLATSLLFWATARRLWRWGILRATLVCGLFVLLELSFVTANFFKLFQGGWFPLAVGMFLFLLMTTWKKGRSGLRAKLADTYLPLDLFLPSLDKQSIHRVPGTAIFLSSNPSGTPLALLHNLKHNKVLHERVVLLTVQTKDVPFVDEAERLQTSQPRPDVYLVRGYYGFMEQPNVPRLLQECARQGVDVNEPEATYFLSRETIIPREGPSMAPWRKRLFAAISRNAQSATTFFQLPPNRVVELGMQVEV